VKQNYPGSVAFYHTRPGNEVGLFYSSRAHTGRYYVHCYTLTTLGIWVTAVAGSMIEAAPSYSDFCDAAWDSDGFGRSL